MYHKNHLYKFSRGTIPSTKFRSRRNHTMKFMDIKTLDIANGPGCRISLFVSGCTHHCKGCFNAESWDFNAGEEFTEEIQEKIIELLKPDYIDGLSILGGEPFEKDNVMTLYHFLQKVRWTYPNIDIWMYSGYTFEHLCKGIVTKGILKMIDVLVDGEFEEDKKDIKLQYCGSYNQRVINVQESLKDNTIYELDKYNTNWIKRKYSKEEISNV